MARFITYAEGRASTVASRLGTANSGVTARAQGWDVGVTVRGYVGADGYDKFAVYANGGSNGGQSDEPLLLVADTATGRTVTVANSMFRTALALNGVVEEVTI